MFIHLLKIITQDKYTVLVPSSIHFEIRQFYLSKNRLTQYISFADMVRKTKQILQFTLYFVRNHKTKNNFTRSLPFKVHASKWYVYNYFFQNKSIKYSSQRVTTLTNNNSQNITYIATCAILLNIFLPAIQDA